MAIYERNSRYAKFAKIEETTDAEGRKVLTMGVARVPAQKELGEHIRRDGQRLDHLASYYLKDASAYWRICEMNDVLLPDQLAEVELIRIPTRI
jgi:hypothetical protein